MKKIDILPSEHFYRNMITVYTTDRLKFTKLIEYMLKQQKTDALSHGGIYIISGPIYLLFLSFFGICSICHTDIKYLMIRPAQYFDFNFV